MADGAGRDAYERARKAVDAGKFEDALASAEEAHRLEPEDTPIRELYTGLLLARGVKLAAAARDLRRQDIVDRDLPVDTEFEDSERVRNAYGKALGAFNAVLAL